MGAVSWKNVASSSPRLLPACSCFGSSSPGYSGYYSGYDSSTAGYYSGYSGYDSSSPGYYSGYSGYDSSTAGYSGYSGDGSGSLERIGTLEEMECVDKIPDCTFVRSMETSAPTFFAAMCDMPNIAEGCCVTCN